MPAHDFSGGVRPPLKPLAAVRLTGARREGLMTVLLVGVFLLSLQIRVALSDATFPSTRERLEATGVDPDDVHAVRTVAREHASHWIRIDAIRWLGEKGHDITEFVTDRNVDVRIAVLGMDAVPEAMRRRQAEQDYHRLLRGEISGEPEGYPRGNTWDMERTLRVGKVLVALGDPEPLESAERLIRSPRALLRDRAVRVLVTALGRSDGFEGKTTAGARKALVTAVCEEPSRSTATGWVSLLAVTGGKECWEVLSAVEVIGKYDYIRRAASIARGTVERQLRKGGNQ